MKNFIYIALLMCLIFYSCTSTQSSYTSSNITIEDIKQRVNANAQRLKALDADGEISIDSPNLSNTGSITVSIIKPDSVYTKLEGPFGIDIADLLITRENFIYYNVQDNRVIRGSSTPHNLGIIMKIKVTFDEIINGFSGNYFLINEGYTDSSVNITEEGYLISFKSQEETREYSINPENFYVTKLTSYDSNKEPKLEIVYENFFENDGIYFPKKISISRPKEKQFIILNYNREKFNQDRLTYRLKIPKSAKQITWK